MRSCAASGSLVDFAGTTSAILQSVYNVFTRGADYAVAEPVPDWERHGARNARPPSRDAGRHYEPLIQAGCISLGEGPAPMITIIFSSYNGARTLPRMLEGLCALRGDGLRYKVVAV